jgi:hypothetical protein
MTPNDAQNQVNAQITTNYSGKVTATVLAGVLSSIIGIFALYGSLSGNNTWTGTNIFSGTVTVNGAITAPEFPNLSSNVEGTGVPGLDGGHWFVWNQPGSFDSQETFRVDRHVNSGTGLTGNTYKALSVFSTGNPANAGYEWTFLSNQFNTANASTGSQNVSTAAYMFKKPPTNTMPTVAASGTGSVAVGDQRFINNGVTAPTYHLAVSSTGTGQWPVSCTYNGTTYSWVY